jgi:hypothetical protein
MKLTFLPGLLMLPYLYYLSQALPIFLDSLVPSWGAVLISVTLILAFGEVIHSPILLACSAPNSTFSFTK